MLYRSLAAAAFLSASVALTAQSSVSFENSVDLAQTTNSSLSNSISAAGTIVAGDFNNSGKPGLIECCNTSAQMVFRAGNGDGTFQAPLVASATPVSVMSAVAADVNGDGKLDVVAIAALNPPSPPDTGTYSLTVWLGNGDGTFQPAEQYNTTNAPMKVLTGNFFGDGHTAIVVTEQNSTIDYFRNTGGGEFAFAKSVTTSGESNWSSAAAGDFNGNGITDLALLEVPAGNNEGLPFDLWVIWSDGKGNFTPQDMGGGYSYALYLTASRLNGAAADDLVVAWQCAPPSGDQYCLAFDGWYGQGNNTLFQRHLVQDTSGINIGDLGQIFAADVNGDGYGDIVAVGAMECDTTTGQCNTPWPYALDVWTGNANGSFQQTSQQLFFATGYTPGASTMADFNRDGMMDFATALPRSGGQTQIFLNATNRAACGTYTINPTVTVCQPVDNTYSPSPVTVEANSYDTYKVTAMQEYIDGTLEYAKPVTSFDVTFPVADGPHRFVTKAWDASGRSFVADRTVTAYTGTPGPVCSAAPDSASICLPGGDTSSSPVTIVGNGNTGVTLASSVQLYIDGKLTVNNHSPACAYQGCYGVDTAIQTTQDLAPGIHKLVFKIWDDAGHVYQASKSVTVD